MNAKHATVGLSVLALSGVVSAADFIIDGTIDPIFGPARAVQNSMTQFGDSNLGVIDFANGSELDTAFGIVSGGVLYLGFGGNLESNFNKLEVFLDAVPDAGQNRLRGDNPDVDFNGLNRMGDDGSGNGLTFEPDFWADFYTTTTCGGDPFATYANVAEILTDGGGNGEYIGTGGAGENALVAANGVIVGYNNSNVRGVIGGTKMGDGSGVMTGIEIAIPTNLIPGYNGGDIKVCAFINGQGHDFVSNQFLEGMGGGPNLGEPRDVLFEFVPGVQYFVVEGEGKQSCPWDLDNSGSVDAADLANLLGGWGSPYGPADLGALLGAWGDCI